MPANFPPMTDDDLVHAEQLAAAFESRDWHKHQSAEIDMQFFHVPSRLCAEVHRLRNALIAITDVVPCENHPTEYIDRVDTIAHEALGEVK